MTSKGGIWALVVLGIVLLGLTIGVASIEVPTIDQTNAATILGLVTAGAVGIERALEGFWTMVGMSRLGNWWPLKPIGERLDEFVDQLNTPLNDFYQRAQAQMETASEATANFRPWLEDKDTYLRELSSHIRDLQQLAPGSREAQAIAARASRAVVGLEKHYPQLRSYAASANKALASVNEFVQTFEDNPARRLLSLYAGAVLGLLMAGLLGLDVVQAVYGGVPSGGLVEVVYEGLPGIGAAATGLVMGFGATPTHEVIKTLQETKERNKAQARRP